jgi:hypothetical protein
MCLLATWTREKLKKNSRLLSGKIGAQGRMGIVPKKDQLRKKAEGRLEWRPRGELALPPEKPNPTRRAPQPPRAGDRLWCRTKKGQEIWP